MLFSPDDPYPLGDPPIERYTNKFDRYPDDVRVTTSTSSRESHWIPPPDPHLHFCKNLSHLTFSTSTIPTRAYSPVALRIAFHNILNSHILHSLSKLQQVTLIIEYRKTGRAKAFPYAVNGYFAKFNEARRLIDQSLMCEGKLENGEGLQTLLDLVETFGQPGDSPFGNLRRQVWNWDARRMKGNEDVGTWSRG